MIRIAALAAALALSCTAGAEPRSPQQDLVSQIYQRQQLACQLARKAILLVFRSEGAGGIKQYPVLNDVSGRCESERNDGYKLKPALAGDPQSLAALRERLQLLDRQISLLNDLITTLQTADPGAADD